jgi:hypothetical protein
MDEDHDGGSMTVTLGFDPYQPPKDASYEINVLHLLDYIARAVGVLADAKIKENQ